MKQRELIKRLENGGFVFERLAKAILRRRGLL